MTVSPSAVTAQRIMFSVAPTEGKARFIFAPLALPEAALHMMLAVVAFLFVLDFSVKKPDWKKLFTKAA